MFLYQISMCLQVPYLNLDIMRFHLSLYLYIFFFSLFTGNNTVLVCPPHRFKLELVVPRAWIGQQWSCRCIKCGLSDVDIKSPWWMKCLVRLPESRFIYLPVFSHPYFQLYLFFIMYYLPYKEGNQYKTIRSNLTALLFNS